jgi:hypothetical protein
MLFLTAKQRGGEKIMRWLETIKVQAASGKESGVENELTALFCDVRKSPKCPGLLEAVV